MPGIQQLAGASAPLIKLSDLIFHPAPAGATITDPKTGAVMHLDGWHKTPDGRTLYVALSSPGSILRTPEDFCR
jgi:hypothetical protein